MSDENEMNEVVKELIDEVKKMNNRIKALEAENSSLKKAVDDPSMLMRKHGWISFTTPHADETYDPLNRNDEVEQSSVGPFAGTGDMITKSKSRHDEIKEWEDAERQMQSR